MDAPRIVNLGRMPYARAFEVQREHLEQVLTARDQGSPELGRILVVEHDPVITVSRRAGAAGHLLATAEQLSRLGVAVESTDRGGDITYHGPGQVVVYPILDLNRCNLGLHAYMRLLEQAVIDACSGWGIEAMRDPKATGVWVRCDGSPAKIAAMGVRVRRWVSMHGLSFNVAPDMSHFDLIVPCGLAGRAVTSLDAQLLGRGMSAVTFDAAAEAIVAALTKGVVAAADQADRVRREAATSNPS